jgi:regulator of cell morphogenesis and NO signaling
MKKPSIDPKATLAEIVLEHPECARVFRDHRLDYCCRGEQGLASACDAKGLDLAKVVAALEAALSEREKRRGVVDPRALSTSALVKHIIEHHHRYLRQSLPYAEELVRKVSRVHGDHNPKLAPLADAVIALRASLEPHLDEEEQHLFAHATATRSGVDEAIVRDEIDSMKNEHLAVGEMLARIRTLADDYVAPEWACRSYRALVDTLAELEDDTLEHIHLENHVLAPRCAARA